jgi:WD40 repeat protein
MFKIDTANEKIIDLNYRVPFFSYGENYTFGASFGNISNGKIGPDGRLYFSIMYGPDIIALDTKSGKIENMGPYLPTDRYAITENRNGVFGFDFDSKGVMWYCVSSVSDGSVPEQPAQPASLFRWDLINGGRPEWAGIIGTHERVCYVHSELHIHNDNIMIVETNHADESASVFTIDLNDFEPSINQMNQVDLTRIKDNMFKPGNPTSYGYSRLFDHQAKISDENPHSFDGKIYEAHRIWRELAPENIENSPIQNIVWHEDGSLHGLCGNKNEYVFKIAEGKVEYVTPINKMNEDYVLGLRKKDSLKNLDQAIVLPSYPGRQYKAVASSFAEMSGNRTLIGTLDGFIAVRCENQLYWLGMAGSNGPIRDMCSTPDGKTVYGVAGDAEDLGMVFTYDDSYGLRLRGYIKHGSSKLSSGIISCNVLSCCRVSKDGNFLAIASADRLGTVVIYTLK